MHNTLEHYRLMRQPAATIQYLVDPEPTFVFREPTTQVFYCKNCHIGFRHPIELQSHARQCLAVEDNSDVDVADWDPHQPPNPQMFCDQRPLTPDIPIPSDILNFANEVDSSPLGPQLAWQMPSTRPQRTGIRETYRSYANDDIPPEPAPLFVPRPGSDTVISHAEIPLERLGLVINTKFQRIICLACRRHVLSHQLFQHLSDHFGRQISIPRNITTLIKEHFEIDSRNTPTHPEGPDEIPAIFGLVIHRDFEFCGFCGNGYALTSSLDDHFVTCPRRNGVQPVTLSGYAQTFATGPMRRFFRVRLQPGETIGVDTLLASRRDRQQPKTMPMFAVADCEDVGQFLVTEGWEAHVRRFPAAKLHKLVSFPSTSEPNLGALHRHVLSYLQWGQALMQTSRSSGLLQKLADFGGCQILNSFDIVTSKTLETYAGYLERVLCFVMRIENTDDTMYTCRVSLAQSRCCDGLWDALESNAEDEESIVPLIHSLAYRLFSDEGDAVSRALILLSRLEEGGWYPVGFITNIIASLIYSARSTMLYHLYVLAKTQLKLIDDVLGEVQPFLMDKGDVPISHLITTYQRLVRLRANDEAHSCTRFLDEQRQMLVYKGDLVCLDDIGRMTLALVDQYRMLLDRDIFHGLSDDPSLVLEYDMIKLDNQTPFYSFIDVLVEKNKNNNLLELLLTHPSVAGRYHFVADDRVIWHPVASLNLLETIQRARTLLLVMTHINRGGDVVTQTIANMMRSMFIWRGRLCIAGANSESSASRVLERALPDFLAKLWIQHLVLIRPVEVEIASALYGDKAHLRPMATRKLARQDFASVLGDWTRDYLGTRLTVQDWREVQACFARRHSGLTGVD